MAARNALCAGELEAEPTVCLKHPRNSKQLLINNESTSVDRLLFAVNTPISERNAGLPYEEMYLMSNQD